MTGPVKIRVEAYLGEQDMLDSTASNISPQRVQNEFKTVVSCKLVASVNICASLTRSINVDGLVRGSTSSSAHPSRELDVQRKGRGSEKLGSGQRDKLVPHERG